MQVLGMVPVAAGSENGLKRAAGCAAKRGDELAVLLGRIELDGDCRSGRQGERGDVECVAEGMLRKLLRSVAWATDIGGDVRNRRQRLAEDLAGRRRNYVFGEARGSLGKGA